MANDIKGQNDQMFTELDQDLERTFTELSFFRLDETRSALRRVLTAFTNYDQHVGYV